jgi:site-specific recombinase XerD
MKQTMRLFQRGGWYHIEFYRDKRKALKTKDPKEAERLYRDIEKEYLRGRLINLENLKRCTISQFKEIYLNTRSAHSRGTVMKDETSIKALKEALGDIQIRAITQGKIEDFKRICLTRGVKPESVNSYLRHIKAALTYAVDEKLLEKKPKIKMCPTEQRLPRVNAPEDLTAILNKAKETDRELWRLFMFYLWTGCRRKEALNLNWQDCRFWTEKGRGKEISGECKIKGKGGRERMIPLLKPVIEALYPGRLDIGPVFQCGHPDTVTHKFMEIARSCGVNARLHDLRHNAVTYMLKSGIPIQVVQKIVGHSQLSTTLIYTHVLNDVKQKEMKKLRFE